MKYFKYGHGKWYPDNLVGHIKYEYRNFVKGLSLIGKMMERMQKHERK